MADFKATAMSGSLTRLVSGETYLIGGANIDITTGSDDRVTIVGTGGGGSSEWTRASGDLHSTTNPTTTDLLIGNTAEATANTILKAGGSAIFNEQGTTADFRVESDNLQGAILVDGGTEQIILGTNSTAAAGESVPIGADIRLLLSGTIGSRGANSKGATLISGDAITSGSLTVHNSGKSGGTISGSIHHTEGGVSYLIGGANVTVASGTNGQVTISSTDTNTTYSAGDGLDLTGTTFSTDLKSGGGLVIDSTELAIDTVGADNAILGRSAATPVNADTIWFSDADDDTIKKATIGSLPFIASEWTETGGVLHPADSSGDQDVVVGGTTTTNSDIVLRKEGGLVVNQILGTTSNSDFVHFGSPASKEIIASHASSNQVLILSGGSGTGTSANEKNYPDMAFFVSGAIGSRNTSNKGVSIFGGDTLISGSLTVHNSGKVGGTISGSIHHTEDGLSYLVGGSNVTVTSASNGQVTINSTGGGTPGGSNTQVQFNDGGAFGGISGATTDGTAVTFSDAGIFVGQDIAHAGDTDTKIVFADDSIGFTAGNEQLLMLQESGQDLVQVGDGGDVDFQVRTLNDDNALFVQGSTDRVGIGTDSPSKKLHVAGDVHVVGTAPIVSIQRDNNNDDSTISFLGSGGNTGAIAHLASTNDLVFKTHNGSTPEEMLRLGSHYGVLNRQVIMLSGSTMHVGAMQPKESVDINFFVSGAMGSKDTSTRGTAVFGGDLVVSGVLHAKGGHTHNGLSAAAIVLDSTSASRIIWDSSGTSGHAPDAQIYESSQDLIVSASQLMKLYSGDQFQFYESSDASGAFARFIAQPTDGDYYSVLDVRDTGVVVNEDSQSGYDFRVESDDNAGMFVVDANVNVAMLNSPATSVAGESPGLGLDVAVFMSGTRDGINAQAPAGGGVVLASGDMFVSGAIYEGDQVLLSMRTLKDCTENNAAVANTEYAVFDTNNFSAVGGNDFSDVIPAQNCSISSSGIISVTSLNHNKRHNLFSFMVRVVAPTSTNDAFIRIRDNGTGGSLLWETQVKLIGGGNDEKCVSATVILPTNTKPTLTVQGNGQVVTAKAGSTITLKNA